MTDPTEPRAGRTPTLRGTGTSHGARRSERPSVGDDATTATRSLHAGMIVAGKFALVRLLYEDASSRSFEAEDTLLGRRVALRLLRPELVHSPDAARKLRRDAHAAMLAAHPSLEAVYEVGRRSDGSLFVACELVQGVTLAAHRADRGRLDEREALELITPISGALAAAHAQGLAHREVTPTNIVIVHAAFTRPVPKIVELRPGRPDPTGLHRYHAPELRERRGPADARSDVWSLAAVLCDLMGEPAAEGVAVPAGARRELSELLSRCLAPAPESRPEMRGVFFELSKLEHAQSTPNLGPEGRGESLDADYGELSDEDVEEVQPLELEVDPDEDRVTVPPAVQAVTSEGAAAGDWMRSTSQVESDFARGPLDGAADAAQRALRVNALEEAVVHADIAIASGAASGELLGQLHLVRTMAELWLGRYEASEQAALATLSILPDGAVGWYAALGHLALARARLGRFEQRDAALPELSRPGGRASSAHVIAACRMAVALVRAGDLARARALVRAARERSEPSASSDPAVNAWLDVALAERSAFVGDLARELPGRASALERFTAAGDVRNACEQRGALGAVLLRLGAFDEAERLLHEALGIAEPMKLAIASQIKAYLALAAFRQGELGRARSLIAAALEEAEPRADRFTLAHAHAFSALIGALGDDHSGALSAADAAVTEAEPFPALLAHTLGVRAATLLVAGHTAAALEPARRAMALLAERGGAGEGESMARLTHALVLAQSGDQTESRRTMKAARDRVVGLAERLSDRRYKRAFLEKIPENARILQLGAEWLDGG